jgi:hypothetical protein
MNSRETASINVSKISLKYSKVTNSWSKENYMTCQKRDE